jgi:anti-sigma-K factor RskA
LLRDYVELRIRVATRQSLSELQELVTRSEGIQDALWKEATTLSDRPSASLSIFVQSLSELTDLQMKRVRAAVWNRIPPTIVLTLYGIAFLALTAMGYGAGLAESRTTVPSVMLILTFSAIIVLIVDLERPRQQLFEVSQQPMADVARRIQSFQP